MKIENVRAREILDSRGNPTLEVSVFSNGKRFVSSVPSGASTGSYEAKELRDGGDRFNGKGVLKAVENVNSKIKSLIVGKEVDPVNIDKIILEADGTENKENFGANAILGVSMSVFRARAYMEKKELYDYISNFSSCEKKLPIPCFNIVNGGVHASGGVSFQEFMVVSQKESFSESLRFGVEFMGKLKENIFSNYGGESTNIGDEGGFVPKIRTEEEVLSLLSQTDRNASFLIDVAATEFYKQGSYFLGGEKKKKEELIEFYKELKEKFAIIGLEDPFEENDFESWSFLSKELGEGLIVGDDLLVTNIKRMRVAKESGACNSMILKINQIGSITEAISAYKLAKEFNWKVVVSHRSGETNDAFIADLAVGLGADYIKSGAPQRGERIAKYNRLLEIETELEDNYL